MGDVLKLSSGSPGERFAQWREVICQTFVHLDPATDAPERFRGRLDVRRCGSLLAADIAATPQRVERSRRGIAQSPDMASGGIYFVNLQLAGRGWHAQGGNECVLRPGEFAVLDATEPFTMAFDAPFHQLSLKVPHETWRAISGRNRPSLARTAPIDLELSRRYVGLIDRALGDGRTIQAEGIVESLIALTSALAGDDDVVAPILDPRLDALKAWIDRHLTDPSLAPADAAEAIGLSLRSAHSLFEGSGTTFSAYVRARRLALASRMLRTSHGRDRRIIDIAFMTGFGDLSAFGRAFQKSFGMSPSAYRRRHRPPAVH